MSTFLKSVSDALAKTPLAPLGIRAPFTVPSGIVTTVPSVIARVARDVPQIGFLTTKTISLEPRQGYREPVLHEYHPGCFVNAVGLANPGARAFRAAMEPLLPLYDDKPLVVSIMGGSPEEFLETARLLEPIADAFELNLSCPHVKGAGQSVGSDPGAVRGTLRLLKKNIGKPIIPKLSPNLADLPGMAGLCEREGADGLTLINTVGPGLVCDCDGNPVLSNVVGGLSGSGVLPIGLKAVQEAAAHVSIPIIAAGGIGSPGHVKAYRNAGATLFSVGSALAGMTTLQLAEFFERLVAGLEYGDSPSQSPNLSRPITMTTYFKTRVTRNEALGRDLFRLELADSPPCEPGRFFFLRLPGVGEKPFSPARDEPPVFFVRAIGLFTRALAALAPSDIVFLRGPHGTGFPRPQTGQPLVLIGGGTGTAPLMMAASKVLGNIADAFFGFSGEISAGFREEILTTVPGSRILIDPPGRPGEVVRAVEQWVKACPTSLERPLVFICGPAPMMSAAATVVGRIVPTERIFTAREDIMRCGIGICGICGTPDGLRSCVDGPVMNPVTT